MFTKLLFKNVHRNYMLNGSKRLWCQFSSQQKEQTHESLIESKIKLNDIRPQINSYDNLVEFYSRLIDNQNQQQLNKFEIEYYNEECAKQLKVFLQDDEKLYQQFLTQMLLKKELNLNCIKDLFKHCGKSDLFPSNQKLIMSNILEKKQEEYQRILKKAISYINLYLKIFVVGYIISFLYRAYYYFEYDISIYHPRATAWHVYRFR